MSEEIRSAGPVLITAQTLSAFFYSFECPCKSSSIFHSEDWRPARVFLSPFLRALVKAKRQGSPKTSQKEKDRKAFHFHCKTIIRVFSVIFHFNNILTKTRIFLRHLWCAHHITGFKTIASAPTAILFLCLFPTLTLSPIQMIEWPSLPPGLLPTQADCHVPSFTAARV